MPLLRGGRPVIRILTGANATAAEEYAAEEIRLHLWRMATGSPAGTGKDETVDAAIHVNDWKAAEAAGIAVERLGLEPEQFLLETRNRHLYLLGGSPRGVLYGAYELLEKLGCRWYTPEISHIPRRDVLDLPPLRQTGGPAFRFRDMAIWEAMDPAWWVRNRLNGHYLPIPEYMGGHVAYGLFVHTFYRLVPPRKYFKTHPEYFSLTGGKRTCESAQLCLTNPTVVRIVADGVLKFMRENPRATLFSVSQNDGTQKYCECPKCQELAVTEGSQSGPLLHFVNAVAKRTASVFPDKLIDTLAYDYTLDAPRHVRPHANVRVRLCPINCCQGHGFGTCDHPESARFLRTLKAWSHRKSQIYIWHYCVNGAHYPLPTPDFDELCANIRLYRRLGVHGLFMQGGYEDGSGSESAPLRAYVLTKLMWNPDRALWPLVDEFLAAYYGAAGSQVRRYLDVFHSRVRKDRNLHPSIFDPPGHSLFREDTLAAADRALARGECRVDGKHKFRVQLLRGGLAYAKYCRQAFSYRSEGRFLRVISPGFDPGAARSMLKNWRRAGFLIVHEAMPLETTEQRLELKRRNHGKRHPLIWLEDDTQSIAVVPGLGGRLWAWKTRGWQWLAQSDTDNHLNGEQMAEGYAEFLFVGPGWRGWTEPCRYRKNGNKLWLEWTELPSGFRMRRQMELRDGALHIANWIANENREENLHAAWGIGLHLSPPPRGLPTVGYDSREGKLCQVAWHELSDQSNVSRNMVGGQTPAKKWWIDFQGCRLIHEFQCEPMGLVKIGKDAGRRILKLAVRSDNVLLPPGGKLLGTQILRFESSRS